MDDPLGVFGDVTLVGHHQDGVALVLQALEQPHYLLAGLAVEVAGRFVGEDDGRTRRQRAGDGDALALTAGEFVRPVVGAVGETNLVEALFGAFDPLRPADLLKDEGERDVLGGG